MMNRSAEKKLIQVGLEWLARGGVRGMKLRRICAEAGVSPGTFTAHFPTLEIFCEQVLAVWYEPLRTAVAQQSMSGGLPMACLRASLKTAIHFLHANAAVLMQLVMDVGAGETKAYTVLRLAQSGHVAQVQRALRAAQEAGELVEAPTEQLLFYLMGAVGLPVLLYHTLDGRLPDDIKIYEGLRDMVSEQRMLERLDWALKGISK